MLRFLWEAGYYLVKADDEDPAQTAGEAADSGGSAKPG